MFKTYLFLSILLFSCFISFSQQVYINASVTDAQVLFGVKKIKNAATQKKNGNL